MVMNTRRGRQRRTDAATTPANAEETTAPAKTGGHRRRRPRLPARELLDEEYALRPLPRSSFLNRFFEPAPPEEPQGTAPPPPSTTKTPSLAAAASHRPRTPASPSSPSPASSCPEDESSSGESSDRAASPGEPGVRLQREHAPTRPVEILFQPLRADFSAESRDDRLRIVNTQPVRVFERSRPMLLGARVRVPAGYCGVFTCQRPAECVCVAEPVGAGQMDLRAQLLNVGREPLDIPPGELVLYFHLLPEAPPEPWQTVNLPAPTGSTGGETPAMFELRLDRPARLNSQQPRHLTFETAHLCFGGDAHALIVPCRQPALRQVALEPMIWPPGRVPAVRAVNVGTETVELPAGLAVARVLFIKVPVKSTPAVRPSPIRGLRIPRVPIAFRQLSLATPTTGPGNVAETRAGTGSPPQNNKKRGVKPPSK